MFNVTSIEPAIDLNHRPAYIIDWELTYFCNLDCSYCRNHDNSTKHPDKEECKKSVDFMLKYADIILSAKKSFGRAVTLNLLGGETLIHPDIVEILEYLNQVYTTTYKDRWPLTVSLMTNGIVGKNVLEKCLPIIDYWTVSYHTESNDKQKAMSIDTMYAIRDAGKPLNVRVMAHSGNANFKECVELSEQLTRDNIKNALKPIGVHGSDAQWTVENPEVHRYTKPQTEYVLKYYNSKNTNQLSLSSAVQVDDKYVIASAGYPCCSEKDLCVNLDRKNTVTHIPRTNFKEWYCSVNWEFLYIKQHERNVYHNTACLVNYENQVAPIGSLDQTDKMLLDMQTRIQTKSVPVIRCPKDRCGCGICAPKAETKESFEQIIKLRLDSSVLLY